MQNLPLKIKRLNYKFYFYFLISLLLVNISAYTYHYGLNIYAASAIIINIPFLLIITSIILPKWNYVEISSNSIYYRVPGLKINIPWENIREIHKPLFCHHSSVLYLFGIFFWSNISSIPRFRSSWIHKLLNDSGNLAPHHGQLLQLDKIRLPAYDLLL